MASIFVRPSNVWYNAFRSFSCARINSQNVPSSSKEKIVPPDNTQELGLRKLNALTPITRWALVFSGKYKSQKDIPDRISIEVVEKARSRARIKISNYLMVMTILACLGYAYSGRKAADRGESVVKMNMDWHKEYQAQVAQERAAAAVQKTA